MKREVSRTEKKVPDSGLRRRSREERNGFVKADVLKFVYIYLRDFFALKTFHDYSLCSVGILPRLRFTLSLQSAFYTQSAFCPWCAVRSPQSAVRSPQSAVHSPQSAVRSPQSAIHSPQSTVHGTFNTDFPYMAPTPIT